MKKINVISNELFTKIEFDFNLYEIDRQEMETIVLSRFMAGFSGAVNLDYLDSGLIFISFNSVNNRDQQIVSKITSYIEECRI